MTDQSFRNSYEDRLNRVTDYIYEHLDEDIDLLRLADIACLSPYHWHRIYHAIRGETIAATVKRLRLHRAAGYLANTSKPLAEIAARSGYPNLQSFSRTFKATYGLPPAEYRRAGSHTKFAVPQTAKDNTMYDISLRDAGAVWAVGVDHVGSYMDVGRAFGRLYDCLGARGLFRPDMRMVGVYFDDPASVPEAELRSRACVTTAEPIPIEAPLVETPIAGGTFAVLLHKGPYADMRVAYNWLYGQWLPKSGREPGDAPVFEVYLNTPQDTAPTELLTEIWLPLKAQEAAA